MDRSRARGGKQFEADFSLMGAHASSPADLAMDGMDDRRPWPPCARLRAARSAAFAPDKPVRELRLTLDGDRERYVWFLDNTALSPSDDILVREGEIVRFILINRTMMHHPTHPHGHFFRVVNGQGERSPLKHTVVVAPMSTTIIEFDAVEPGDWFFHGHLLCQMMNGMASAVHYADFALTPRLDVAGAVRYDTHDLWEGQAGFAFTLSKELSLLARRHSAFGFGGGLQIRF